MRRFALMFSEFSEALDAVVTLPDAPSEGERRHAMRGLDRLRAHLLTAHGEHAHRCTSLYRLTRIAWLLSLDVASARAEARALRAALERSASLASRHGARIG